MPIQIEDRSIERVSIVDDQERARESYAYSIEDLDLTPVPVTGPLNDLDHFVDHISDQTQAVLCDYRLRQRNYARFDGDEIVVQCYKCSFPAVLCTTYTDMDISLIRSRRRFIPVLLRPNELDPDAIHRGFQRCIQEFNGQFQPSRRPWRTLIRVIETVSDEPFFYVVIPGWDLRQKIRVYLEDLPQNMHSLVEPGKRFHAQVNTGAERHEELYFDSWETD